MQSVDQIVAIGALVALVFTFTGHIWLSKLTLDRQVKRGDRQERYVNLFKNILLLKGFITVDQLRDIEEDEL